MTSSMLFTPSLVRNFSDISSISMSWLNFTVLLLLLLYIPLQPMLPFRIDLQVEDLLNNNLPKMLVHGFFHRSHYLRCAVGPKLRASLNVCGCESN